jgi:hypothetical protein
MSTGSKKRTSESIDHISDGEPISKKSKMKEPAEVGKGSPEQANEQGIKHKATHDLSVELAPRDHEAFKWLKDMKELVKHANETVVLPMLGPTPPKELETQASAEGILQPILLTPQRVEVIQRFVNEMQLGQDDVPIRGKGLILSVPNGQGKSILSYLLACTAYANNCVLVYISHCSQFAGLDNDEAALFFLRRMELFNSELLEQITFKNSTPYLQPNNHGSQVIQTSSSCVCSR